MKVKGLLVAAVAAMLCFGAQNASAIEAPNHEGDFNFNAHLGIWPGVGANISGDYVLVNSWWKGHFTIGGYVSYNQKVEEKYFLDLNGNWGERKYTNISILARSTYGLNITDNFEVHAGAMVGPSFHFWKEDPEVDFRDPDGKDNTDIDPAFLAGCRFFITDNIALSAELIESWHQNYLNLGVSFKF